MKFQSGRSGGARTRVYLIPNQADGQLSKHSVNWSYLNHSQVRNPSYKDGALLLSQGSKFLDALAFSN